jgi:hypothetical protein
MLLQAARERAAWYIGKKLPAALFSDISAFPAAKSVVFAAFRVA